MAVSLRTLLAAGVFRFEAVGIQLQYAALMRASEEGHASVVEHLITHPHVDVNRKNEVADQTLEGFPKVFKALEHYVSPDAKWTVGISNTEENKGKLVVKGRSAGAEYQLLYANGQWKFTSKKKNYKKDGKWVYKGNTWHAYGSPDIFSDGGSPPETLVWVADQKPYVVTWSRFYEDTDGTGTGQTALMVASEEGHTPVVKHLLTHPQIDPNIQNKDGTALMYAAYQGHISVVESLLTNPQTDVNIQNIYGKTALSYAAEAGNTSIVDLLLTHPYTNVNVQDEEYFTALLRASDQGDTSVVDRLLAHPQINVNIQTQNGTALMHAAYKGHASVFERLFAYPYTNVNLQDNEYFTVLMRGSDAGNVSLVERLLTHPQINVNIQNSNGTALVHAAYKGHAAVVERLLAHPHIDVNMKNQFGKSALLYAAKESHTSVVELLLKHPNIQVDFQEADGWTSLNLARHTGVVQMIQGHLAKYF